MKKRSRYVVGFILLLLFYFISVPIQAYQQENYVYDEGEELQEEVKEEVRQILKDFNNQTHIKAIVVTLRKEAEQEGKQLVEDVMQRYNQRNTMVIIFSQNRRIVSCSYVKVDIFPYIKSIFNTDTNYEYGKFVKSATIGILQQIAEEENVKFSIPVEKVNFIELLGGEDLRNLILAVSIIISIIVIAMTILLLEIFIIGLCITELINTFSS